MQGLGSYRGISDIIAIKNGGVLFIEVKAPGGSLSHHQRRFAKNIKASGGHYILAFSYEDIEDYLKTREGTDG